MAEVKTIFGKALASIKTVNCKEFANIKAFGGRTVPHGTTLKTGLWACWELNETTGNTVYDSFSTYNGTNTGFNINQPGKLGTCFSRTAANNKVQMGNVLNIGASDFSISGWVKTSDYGTILQKGDNQATAGDFSFGVLNSGKLGATLMFASYNYDHNFYVSTAFPSNEWAFAVLTVDRDGYARIYQNTEEKASNNISAHSAVDLSSGYGLSLGALSSYGNHQNAAANIDQVAIWGKVLTTAEIALLYNSGNGLAYSSW